MGRSTGRRSTLKLLMLSIVFINVLRFSSNFQLPIRFDLEMPSGGSEGGKRPIIIHQLCLGVWKG